MSEKDDFSAAAREYLDEIEGQAIGLLEFGERLTKAELGALDAASNDLRSSFEELVETFFETHRQAHPALAERGYELIWAAMTSAASILRITEGVRLADVRDSLKKHGTYHANRKREQDYEISSAKLVEAVVKAVIKTDSPFAITEDYAVIIRTDVLSELERLGCPAKTIGWPSKWAIRRVLSYHADELRFMSINRGQ
jgi:hypothetical protein